MSIRFSTVAANADVLGEDTPADSPPGETGAGQAARDIERESRHRGQGAGAESATPGKDINAPGFIKDRDASKPS